MISQSGEIFCFFGSNFNFFSLLDMGDFHPGSQRPVPRESRSDRSLAIRSTDTHSSPVLYFRSFSAFVSQTKWVTEHGGHFVPLRNASGRANHTHFQKRIPGLAGHGKQSVHKPVVERWEEHLYFLVVHSNCWNFARDPVENLSFHLLRKINAEPGNLIGAHSLAAKLVEKRTIIGDGTPKLQREFKEEPARSDDAFISRRHLPGSINPSGRNSNKGLR